MPRDLTQLTVFISSPSDVSELRGIAETAVREVSEITKLTKGITLLPISWKSDVVPGVAGDPQEVINDQTIGSYDIYLGIVGARFGSPTPRAGSGTEEEFSLALNRFKKEPLSIRILFYFQKFGFDPFSTDLSQLTEVLSFRNGLNEKGVLFRDLVDLDDGLSSIKAHLLKLVQDAWDTHGKCWKASVNVPRTIDPNGTSDGVDPAIEAVKPTNITPAIVAIHSAIEEVKEEGPVLESLGLLEIYSIANKELRAAGVPLSKLGLDITALTVRFQERMKLLAAEKKPDVDRILEIIDGMADDIESYLNVSRGGLAAGRFHLLRSAEYLEAYFSESSRLGFPAAESPADIAAAINSNEPSLKQLRNQAVLAKQAMTQLPPLTAKLRVAQGNLSSYFDEISLELTVFIERLRLLRDRLSER